ncbi:nucleotide exchange factor GrpE [Kocuria tytonis]|uniref:Nucleotide exchange factor GrpE n=1 Tax=Kocuria tytonis TaxID=2054280 RepID=A0A495A9Q1_9MICC|nr:nucleotide exchange factor GrpE [Kocuria tytonis]RKQ36787.1 nucleotide exchange factor GrpE [Kocuria tytonis]
MTSADHDNAAVPPSEELSTQPHATLEPDPSIEEPREGESMVESLGETESRAMAEPSTAESSRTEPVLREDSARVEAASDDAAEAERVNEPDLEFKSIVLSEVRALRASLDTRVAEYERTIRSLHETVENLQRQQLTGVMKPVFQQFADLQAELQSAGFQAGGRGDQQYAEEFDYFATVIEGLLDHFDLESVEATAGSHFDSKLHMAVQARPTDDAQQDRTIARVLRQGYRVIGEARVLIPARVVILKYAPPAAEAAETPDSTVTG